MIDLTSFIILVAIMLVYTLLVHLWGYRQGLEVTREKIKEEIENYIRDRI